MNAEDLDAVQPGAYIEIQPALWRGYVRTAPVGGRFLADPVIRNPDYAPTSWSLDSITSVRVLAAPVALPTLPGTQFVGVSLAFPDAAVWAVYRSAFSGDVVYVRLLSPGPGDEGATGADDVMVPATEAAARGLRVTGTVRPPLTVDGL